MKTLRYVLIPMLLLVSTSIVLAHGYIERTEPEDGAELDHSPEVINIWFNEPLQPDSGSISIINGKGENIEPLSVRQDTDDTTLISAEIPPNLPDGAYIVTASAVVVSDGHQPAGSFVFWIGEKNTDSSSTRKSAAPAYELVILFLGVMIVSGVTGYFWNQRQQELAIIRPDADSDHFTFE